MGINNGEQTHFLAETIISELIDGVPKAYQSHAIHLIGYITGAQLQLIAECNMTKRLIIDLNDPNSMETAQEWLIDIFRSLQ